MVGHLHNRRASPGSFEQSFTRFALYGLEEHFKTHDSMYSAALGGHLHILLSESALIKNLFLRCLSLSRSRLVLCCW